MFDPNGPFDQSLCDEILINVARKMKSEDTRKLARIKHIAEDLGYERVEVKNNAEYLIMTGLLRGGLGGFLSLSRKGAEATNQRLDDS